jgi:hypothetical protein
MIRTFKTRKILAAVLAIVVAGIAFIYGTVDVATESIQFDLRKIGESIYEAHAKSGKWPMQIADLEGTEYLRMPYRRDILENGTFVIIWQQDLDPNPDANRNRILAYDNGGLLSRLWKVWACRGDLRIVKIGSEEKRMLKSR